MSGKRNFTVYVTDIRPLYDEERCRKAYALADELCRVRIRIRRHFCASFRI